jgi:hypothetical protein
VLFNKRVFISKSVPLHPLKSQMEAIRNIAIILPTSITVKQLWLMINYVSPSVISVQRKHWWLNLITTTRAWKRYVQLLQKNVLQQYKGTQNSLTPWSRLDFGGEVERMADMGFLGGCPLKDQCHKPVLYLQKLLI